MSRPRSIGRALVKCGSILGAIFVAACGGGAASSGPKKVELPVSDGARKANSGKQDGAKQAPPPSGAAKQSPFPAVARGRLPNGMDVAVVTSHALPVVQVRLFVRAGSGYGAAPGVAEITSEMLKDGGTRTMPSAELLRRVETLGSNLSVRTDFDASVISLSLTKDQLPEGLSLLSQIVREPRFDDGELKKLKARLKDDAEDAARSSGSWTATWLLFHELFGDKHPYGSYGALPSQIAKVDRAQIQDFYRRFFVPKAATLVIAGDVDEAAAKELAHRHFGLWTGGDPPKIDFAAPRAPAKTSVIVAHRPKSVQSDVFIASLAPERRSPGWAHVRVANQVLGGGVASRLFSDVREQRSLAYRTSAQIMELSHGQQPLVLYAGTETSKTGQAVTGLLENVAKMTTSPPTQVETETARRYLSDIFAIRMETIGAIADMVVTQETFELLDGYWDAYRKEVRATEPPQAAEAAKRLFADPKELIVVAGDADAIASDLARFGDVTVVDPEKEFKVLRTVPAVKAKP